MNVYLDNELIFSLSPDEIKIIEYGIPTDQVVTDLKRRLTWIIKDQHIGQRLKDLRSEWESKLIAKGATSFPVDDSAFAQLAFADPDYKDASTRLAEAQAQLQAAAQ